MARVGGRAGTSSLRVQMGESMRQYIPVITLALLGAFALAVVSGGLLPSDNAVLADHIDAPDNTAPVFATGERYALDRRELAGGRQHRCAHLGHRPGRRRADLHPGRQPTRPRSTSTPRPDSSSPRRTWTTRILIIQTYVVTVTADDGREATTAVRRSTWSSRSSTWTSQPAAPAAPVVTTGSVSGSETTTLEINWFAPENTGPEHQRLRLPVQGDDGHNLDCGRGYVHLTTTRMTTISPLEADTAYQVSVRAKKRR